MLRNCYSQKVVFQPVSGRSEVRGETVREIPSLSGPVRLKTLAKLRNPNSETGAHDDTGLEQSQAVTSVLALVLSRR